MQQKQGLVTCKMQHWKPVRLIVTFFSTTFTLVSKNVEHATRMNRDKMTKNDRSDQCRYGNPISFMKNMKDIDQNCSC